MRTAFFEALTDLAAADDRVTLVVGDLGYSIVESFAARFPKQYLNIGVAEQNMAGVAAGLALAGRVVFTYSIANFPTLRCLEQVRNDICYHNLNVILVAVGGGFAYGALGASHHATEDLAVTRVLPNMTVVAPGDPIEAGLATRALARRTGPGYLRLGKTGEPVVHRAAVPFEIGRAVTVRDGRDATLIASGGVLPMAVDAADTLARQHRTQVRVLSMHTIKPLDVDAIRAAAAETPAIVTIEEHSEIGGLGSAVAEVLATLDHRPRFRSMALPSRFSNIVGDQQYLRGQAGLSPSRVIQAVQGALASHA